jgi:predicted nucleic acid-binding protein
LGTCLPFLLEAGYSARSSTDHQALMSDLARLPRVHASHEAEKHALQAQHELAAAGHHRLSPIDVMIAACAHEAGAGVLHYDADYDLISRHTTLDFQSVWLAPRGEL